MQVGHPGVGVTLDDEGDGSRPGAGQGYPSDRDQEGHTSGWEGKGKEKEQGNAISKSVEVVMSSCQTF